MNPLQRLSELGQSVYLDEISRGMVADGDLRRLIDDDGVDGVTSNPAIFEKAMVHSHDYDEALADLAGRDLNVTQVYETLAIEDVQAAADLFAERHRASLGQHGYVSLEVIPSLAHDVRGTIEEARRLWTRLDRPNVFVKVPGTRAGLTAFEQLTREGINVNVTLLFGLERYAEVAEAYVRALAWRAEHGEPLHAIQSVASFFLSRIDVAVDARLGAVAQGGGTKAAAAERLRGKAAIASAKGAWERYEAIFGSERFARLAMLGARPQRLLWASTGTKDPAYPDTMYVEALIGAHTITTLPRDTLDAYRDHGDPALRLTDGLDEARDQLRALADVGVDLDEVTAELEREGVEKFVKPFDALLAALGRTLSKARA